MYFKRTFVSGTKKNTNNVKNIHNPPKRINEYSFSASFLITKQITNIIFYLDYENKLHQYS